MFYNNYKVRNLIIDLVVGKHAAEQIDLRWCVSRCESLSSSLSSVFLVVTHGFGHYNVTQVGTQTDCSTHGSELIWNSLMSCSGPVAVATSLERHDELRDETANWLLFNSYQLNATRNWLCGTHMIRFGFLVLLQFWINFQNIVDDFI